MKYCLELDTPNTHILLSHHYSLSSSASSMVPVCLRYSPKGVAKDHISKGGNKLNGAARF